jgi:uncharacterized DUF497 family protein
VTNVELGFEWDENKRRINSANHGIDFEEAIEIFDGRVTVTRRSDYPDEPRFLTFGRRQIDTITVVWTQRGPKRRIISVRRARKNEIERLELEMRLRKTNEDTLTY